MLDNNKILEIKKNQNIFINDILPKIKTQIEDLDKNSYNISRLLDFSVLGETAKDNFKNLIKELNANTKEIKELNSIITEMISQISSKGENTI